MIHQLLAIGQGQAVICLPACEEQENLPVQENIETKFIRACFVARTHEQVPLFPPQVIPWAAIPPQPQCLPPPPFSLHLQTAPSQGSEEGARGPSAAFLLQCHHCWLVQLSATALLQSAG